MIVAQLLSAALVVAVATGPSAGASDGVTLTTRQKSAATESLIRSATDCIIRAVVADPRYRAGSASPLGDLIVSSVPSCLTPVRAMIDAYSRYYGQGTGEAFFMGPYLDVLPRIVNDGASKAVMP